VYIVDLCLPLGGGVGAGNKCFRGCVVGWLVALVGVRFVAAVRWLGRSARVEPVQRFAGRQPFELAIYAKGINHPAALGIEQTIGGMAYYYSAAIAGATGGLHFQAGSAVTVAMPPTWAMQ
jgi:hypothetical protein